MALFNFFLSFIGACIGAIPLISLIRGGDAVRIETLDIFESLIIFVPCLTIGALLTAILLRRTKLSSIKQGAVSLFTGVVPAAIFSMYYAINPRMAPPSCPEDHNPHWAQNAPAGDKVDHFNKISFKFQGGGYSGHPVYEFIIYGDGRIDYQDGLIKWHLSSEQIAAIVTAINKANYFSIPNQYFGAYGYCYNPAGCDPELTGIITSVTVDRKTHEITHESCPFAPEALSTFETELTEITELQKHVKGWTPIPQYMRRTR